MKAGNEGNSEIFIYLINLQELGQLITFWNQRNGNGAEITGKEVKGSYM
jgi:hypothetical protein